MSQPLDETDWIAMHHLQHFIVQGQAAGVDVPRFLKMLGLEQNVPASADSTVPLAALELVLAQLAQEMPDEMIGLRLAASIQPAALGVLGFLSQTCARFSDVLDVAVRYNGLLSSVGHTSVRHAPGQVHILWECRAGGALFRRHASEYVLGCLVTLGRALLQPQPVHPLAVSFPHAAPAAPGLMARYQDLFRAPVYFNAPQACLTLDARLLQAPLCHSDAAIRQTLQRHADELLQRRRQRHALKDDVLHLISAMLGEHLPTREEIARQLGLSCRSLHRKLEQEGQHFRELLDQARLQRAESCLRERAQRLDAIAAEIGFQSHQSFIRWFRQKTGQTPGQYRASQGARM